MVSIIIPSRNEKYLSKTIKDLLAKATGQIEIIAVLDGYWPDASEIIDDSRVIYIHFSTSRGMRNAINCGVAVAKGEYILKTDAHCMFEKGFDEKLSSDCQDKWVVVPRRYRLDPDKWETIQDDRPPVDYMYLDRDLHGRIWDKKNELLIDDLMSSQGSAWFMKKSYFEFLELMDDENYGNFASEFQEIGLKCWLSGGRVAINKKTWYAHWHKDKKSGRGYTLSGEEFNKGSAYTEKWRKGKIWHKQIYELDWLINKFSPVPTW